MHPIKRAASEDRVSAAAVADTLTTFFANGRSLVPQVWKNEKVALFPFN
jgi:hypothetical protein